MTVFDGPRGAPDQRVIQEVLLCLLDELLPRFTLQRGDAAILDGLRASAKPSEEFFNV